MVLDEEEGEFLVYDGGVGVFLGGEFVQQAEQQFQQGVAHDLAGLTNAPLYVAHDLIDLVQRLLHMQGVSTPQFSQKLDAVESQLGPIAFSALKAVLNPVVDGSAAEQFFSC